MSDNRQPHWINCIACNHDWIGFYLPMPINVAIKVVGKLTCPMCGADAKKIMLRKPPETMERKG